MLWILSCCGAPVVAALLLLGVALSGLEANLDSLEAIARTKAWNRHMLVAAGVCLLFFGAGVALRCAPQLAPGLCLPVVERNGRPIVDAIDRYTADHGRPPAAGHELIPEYLPEWPDTGLPSGDGFSYMVHETLEGSTWWELVVWTGVTLDDPSGFSFGSETRKWK